MTLTDLQVLVDAAYRFRQWMWRLVATLRASVYGLIGAIPADEVDNWTFQPILHVTTPDALVTKVPTNGRMPRTIENYERAAYALLKAADAQRMRTDFAVIEVSSFGYEWLVSTAYRLPQIEREKYLDEYPLEMYLLGVLVRSNRNVGHGMMRLARAPVVVEVPA